MHPWQRHRSSSREWQSNKGVSISIPTQLTIGSRLHILRNPIATGDQENAFVTMGIRYLGVLSHTYYCNWNEKYSTTTLQQTQGGPPSPRNGRKMEKWGRYNRGKSQYWGVVPLILLQLGRRISFLIYFSTTPWRTRLEPRFNRERVKCVPYNRNT